jgi:hypothetical protein
MEAAAEIERLREALKQFVFGDETIEQILYRDVADDAQATVTVRMVHLRRARSALSNKGE